MNTCLPCPFGCEICTYDELDTVIDYNDYDSLNELFKNSKCLKCFEPE